MINIKDKSNCCSCNACVQKCPKQCISMREDDEGFLYPYVDKTLCIECGLCEKTCPIINSKEERKPLNVFAAKNQNDEVRMQSSSGGIFTLLAENVIDEGGVVFGAGFNERWEVVHSFAENKKDLAKFRGSKYVQSKVGNSYKLAEAFLKQGRKVLYSGTPCQIAGLKQYLRKDYVNLLAVDFICHGVPSPGVFRTYLRDEINICTARKGGGKNTVLLPCIPLVSERDELDMKGMKIQSISFRDKRNGWKKYGFALVFSKASAEGENSVSLSYKPLNENLFLRGFLKDLYLRPSCYSCKFKGLSSGSDITIADYWNIHTLIPSIDDDKGISAIVATTDKGAVAVPEMKAMLYDATWEDLLQKNPALVRSALFNKNRTKFFQADNRTFEEKIQILCKNQVGVKKLVRIILNKIIVKK